MEHKAWTTAQGDAFMGLRTTPAPLSTAKRSSLVDALNNVTSHDALRPGRKLSARSINIPSSPPSDFAGHSARSLTHLSLIANSPAFNALNSTPTSRLVLHRLPLRKIPPALPMSAPPSSTDTTFRLGRLSIHDIAADIPTPITFSYPPEPTIDGLFDEKFDQNGEPKPILATAVRLSLGSNLAANELMPWSYSTATFAFGACEPTFPWLGRNSPFTKLARDQSAQTALARRLARRDSMASATSAKSFGDPFLSDESTPRAFSFGSLYPEPCQIEHPKRVKEWLRSAAEPVTDQCLPPTAFTFSPLCAEPELSNDEVIDAEGFDPDEDEDGVVDAYGFKHAFSSASGWRASSRASTPSSASSPSAPSSPPTPPKEIGRANSTMASPSIRPSIGLPSRARRGPKRIALSDSEDHPSPARVSGKSKAGAYFEEDPHDDHSDSDDLDDRDGEWEEDWASEAESVAYSASSSGSKRKRAAPSIRSAASSTTSTRTSPMSAPASTSRAARSAPKPRSHDTAPSQSISILHLDPPIFSTEATAKAWYVQQDVKPFSKDGRKRWACPYGDCAKSCSKKGDVPRHMVTHSNENLEKRWCSCGGEFSRQYALDRHLKVAPKSCYDPRLHAARALSKS
ncbi:hypothetical protein BOTBODRAFT_57932 [Botryobasidium botryosum FD-172 SS1]|uniref:C2H2-type domain-containing protein n=1 Tax=Botryobasidium botryosum (strain FD-172 SS1) TaxID=930990 RepID=A0A067MFS2_BOTB1|nr:hypothetical protein BOTBODRAFT_57932 [Botryobasidium botryosum FD-172 SS1]